MDSMGCTGPPWSAPPDVKRSTSSNKEPGSKRAAQLRAGNATPAGRLLQGLKREPHSPEIRQTTGTMCMKTRCDASWDPMQAEAPGQLRTETHGSGQVQTRNNSFTFPERQRTSQPQIRGRGLSPPGACRAGVPPRRHGPKRESKSMRCAFWELGEYYFRL